MIKYEAIYRDTKDKSVPAYVCPVVWDGESWMLQTFNGLKPINYYIPADDAPSGLIEFEDFKATIENGIRACDLKWHDIPRPVKPAVKPEPAIAPTTAPVQKADNWNPQVRGIENSKSTVLDERYSPNFHKKTLIRQAFGDLIVEAFHGYAPNSAERLWRCGCTCGGTIIVSQSDLLLERVWSCNTKNPRPVRGKAVVAN